MVSTDCIDGKLIPAKALYFLYYAGLASFIPYKSIFQKQLGMTTGQNGLIQATMQLVSLFSPPIAGVLTDKTKAYKIILTVCMICSVAFTIPFFFVPEVGYEMVHTNEHCCVFKGTNSSDCLAIENKTDVADCVAEVVDEDAQLLNVNSTFSFTICNSSSADSGCSQCELKYTNCTGTKVELSCSYPNTLEIYSTTFALLVLLTALMSFFLAPVTPLVDASAMDTLGVERVSEYGAQRLWGAVGFGIVGLGVSFITDLMSPEEVYGKDEKNYLPAFASATLFWFLAVAVIISSLNIKSQKAKSVLKGVCKLLPRVNVLAFLLVVFVSGFSTGIQYSYLFWYLQELQTSQSVLGLSVLVTCISEIPMFYVSGWICEKLGYVTVLSIGLFAVAVRFITYSVITRAWQVLLVEWLHGISFALPFAAMCSYAAIIAPKDAVATLISVSQTVYWGLGNMAGALIGGVLYQAYGGPAVFRISAVLCITVALLYLTIFGPLNLVRRCSKETAGPKKEDVPPPEEQPLHTEEKGV